MALAKALAVSHLKKEASMDFRPVYHKAAVATVPDYFAKASRTFPGRPCHMP
jgi:hypothetical protein